MAASCPELRERKEGLRKRKRQGKQKNEGHSVPSNQEKASSNAEATRRCGSNQSAKAKRNHTPDRKQNSAENLIRGRTRCVAGAEVLEISRATTKQPAKGPMHRSGVCPISEEGLDGWMQREAPQQNSPGPLAPMARRHPYTHVMYECSIEFAWCCGPPWDCNLHPWVFRIAQNSADIANSHRNIARTTRCSFSCPCLSCMPKLQLL